MKKEVLVFVFDGFADWEPSYACAEINAPDTGYTVKAIASDRKAKISMGGFSVLPEYSIAECPEDFSLLILPGGSAWLERKNECILPVVEKAIQKRIPVGAICNAVSFLAEHSYLDEIRHSGNTAEFLKMTAPQYKGEQQFVREQAVCDGTIITANGSASLEFAKKLLEVLNVKTESYREEWYRLHRNGFYRN